MPNLSVLGVSLVAGYAVAQSGQPDPVLPESLYIAPANVAHYLWAKDGDVVYQEGGIGPTDTVQVKHEAGGVFA